VSAIHFPSDTNDDPEKCFTICLAILAQKNPDLAAVMLGMVHTAGADSSGDPRHVSGGGDGEKTINFTPDHSAVQDASCGEHAK
jgi:hypothetical protein